MKKIVVFFLLISCLTATSQSESSIKLKGKVVNSKTGDIVPYCSVLINDTFIGTSSNEEGEFIIEVEELPSTLVFSHVSFETIKVAVSENEDLLIKINPLLNVLEEVYIETKSKPLTKDVYANRLAIKACNKLLGEIKNYKHGKALYRQKSKNGSVYSELAEIIFDTRYSLNGIENWEIIEGRYALKKETINNKNFTLFTRIIKSVQPDTYDLIFPLNLTMESFYDIRLVKTIKSENGDIALLRFSPKDDNYSIFKSDVYINKSNYDVLKIVSSIDDDRLDLVKFKNINIDKKNYHIDYEITFKENESLGLVIDYLKINQEFDYFENGFFKSKVSTQSNFTFFEHYPDNIKKRLGRQFNRKKSDWEKLNTIGYNKNFWEENPIIRRTPVEEEVINQFEKDNAFESIYINSRNQITFNQKALLNDPFVNDLSSDIRNFNNNNPIEKIYLHTDKDVYHIGESLWFSAYALLTENRENKLSSSMLYVDILDSNNKIVTTQKSKLSDGRGVGSIVLPTDIKFGNFTLRAYTPWMKNYDSNYFFKKTIKILSEVATHDYVEDDLTLVNFFPEGGDLVTGINSKIAFKAIGKNGLGKKVKGKIINSKKEHILNFNSIYKGIGYFTFTPKPDEKYIAILEDKTQYPLPQIKKSGYVISVNNIKERTVTAKIFASKELRNKPIYVIGRIENRKYYQGKFEFGGNDFVEVEIPKSRLPSGVFTITVLDEERVPFCERVVFVNNMDELVISTKINKNGLKPREKIMLDILVTDPNGQPVVADVSLAVTDKNIVIKSSNASNIFTNFLMESDLRGYIEDPYELLKDNHRATQHKLDLVMLANGWRKLKIERSKSNVPQKEFSLSHGLVFKFRILDSNNNQLKNADVEVVGKSKDKIRMYNLKTDNNGILLLEDLDHTGDTELVFNVLDINREFVQGAKVVSVVNDTKMYTKRYFNKSQEKLVAPKFKKLHEKVNQKFVLTKQDKKYVSDLSSDISFVADSSSVKLEEVVVRARRKKIEEEIKQASPSNYGLTPDNVVFTEGRHEQNITDLLMGVAGVSVIGNQLTIRNGNAPLYIIDGVPIVNQGIADQVSSQASSAAEGNTDGAGGLVFNFNNDIPQEVMNLTVYDIERIEVLKGPNAAMYGSRGAHGVILFYSKVGKVRKKERIKLPTHTIKGYSVIKEFYAPKYDVKKTSRKKDNRSTLFWKPSIITDSNGRASVTFYNSDNADEIQVNIEGLSIYGYPGSYLKTYSSKQ